MALQTSGPISLNDIHVEAGGTTGTTCGLNDSDIRGLIGKGSGVQMGFDEWYGAASEPILISGADFQPIATNSTTVSISANASSYLSTSTSTAAGGLSGFKVQYTMDSAFDNRWVEVRATFTFTNLFSLAALSAADVGKTLYFDQVSIDRSRITNGSEGTATVSTRWYQSDFSTGTLTSSVVASSTLDETLSPSNFGGVITADNNGTASVYVVSAVGLTNSSGTPFTNDAKGMTNIINYISDFSSADRVRVE